MTERATGGAELAERLDLAPELRLVPYAFEETYGRPAAGVWRAPGAVPLLSAGDAGLYVPVRWGAIVAADPSGDDRIELAWMNRPADRLAIPLRDITPGGHHPWNASALAAAWALREAGLKPAGTTLLTGVDLPEGTGTAATTATTCAIATALRDLYAPNLSNADLAPLLAHALHIFGLASTPDPGRCATSLLSRTAEALLHKPGVPTDPPHHPGAGPYTPALPGRTDEAPLSEPGEPTAPLGRGVAGPPVHPVAAGPSLDPVVVGLPFDPVADELRLVVVDTRIRGSVPAAAPEHAALTEARDCLLAGDPAALGPLLTAAHARLRDAGAPDVAQETVVASALEAGALGARMITDGPGRPALLLLRARDLRAIRTAVTAACVSRDLPRPRFLTVSPAPGARRVDAPPLGAEPSAQRR